MKFWDLNNNGGYITLEFTNHCNLDCIMCDTGKIKKENRKHISLELFKKIIDDLKKTKFKAGSIVPFWLGEPTLNPHFAEMMDYCSENLKNIKFEIHTNGTFLNEKVINSILANELIERIVISLDAFSKKVYDKIRRKGDFDKVISNVKDLINKRNVRKKEISFVLQFISMPENINEKDDFIKFWKEELGNIPVVKHENKYPKGDSIFIRRLDSKLYGEAEQIHKSKQITTKSKKFNIFIPYFSIKDQFPSEIYDVISLIPKDLIKRVNEIIDLNQPNSKLDKKEILNSFNEETSINIGFSSKNNIDNVLDMFKVAKEINPFCKNILIGTKKSFLVDEKIPLDEFNWGKIKLIGKVSNPKSKNYSVIMPELFFDEEESEISKRLSKFHSYQNKKYEFIDLNLNKKEIENKNIIIFNKLKNSNAIELGKSLDKRVIYLDENTEKISPIYGIDLQKKKKKVALVVPKLYNLTKFPTDIYSYVSRVYESLKQVFDVKFVDLNFVDKRLDEEVQITFNFAQNNDSLDYLKKAQCKTKVLIETQIDKVKESSYKAYVGLVLYQIDWEKGLPETIFDEVTKEFYYKKNRYSKEFQHLYYEEFEIKTKKCVIISGKDSKIGSFVNPEILPNLFQGNVKLIIPKVEGDVENLEKVIELSKSFETIDLNKNQKISEADIYLLVRFNEIPKVNGKKIIIETKKDRLIDSAANADYVIYIDSFSKDIFTKNAFSLPNSAYKFGENIILGEKEQTLFKQKNNFLKIKTDTINLIMPKFFQDFPKGGYEEIKKIKKNHFFDANFSESNLKEGLNIGLWFEGFNCSLINEFEKTKGKNLVIYFGSNKEKAKQIFTNPKVDFFVYSEDFSNLIFEDLSKIIFKYGKTIINTEILPPIIDNYKASEKTREELFVISNSFRNKQELKNLKFSEVNLIIPKFYQGFPANCYNIAKKIFKSEDNFYDANFSKFALNKGLNVGFWFEGFNSSLIEEFDKTKGKNLIIYYGNNLKEAEELFMNPQVDFIFFSSDFSREILDQKELILNNINKEKYQKPLTSQKKRRELYLESRSVDNDIIDIDPKDWSDSKWDFFGPEVWEGDDKYKDGLSMVFGDNFGYFEYEFTTERKKVIEIHHKVCSHSRVEEKSSKSKSEVTIMINDKEITTKFLPFYSNRSEFVNKIIISNPPLINGKNKLKFLIKEKSKSKKGIVIYGKSLTDEYKHIENPIRIFLRK